jgi:anti-sigma-K factor RskA
MTHENVHELASEYVLGLLDEVTRARVTSHLGTCGACREEVRAVAGVFDAVGRSVPEAEPSASLRERILAIPAAVPQARAVTLPAAAPPVRQGARLVPWFAAVAASLVAVIAVWQAGSAQAEVRQLRDALAQMRLEADNSITIRASLEQQLDEFSRQTTVLRSADLVSYSLAGQAAAVSARARAYVTHNNGLVFAADGLPALPADRIYQLWVIVDAKPVSVGLFSPDASGRVHVVMATPDIPAMPAAVAVTVEPAGGLPQPSTAPILVGTAIQ